MITRRSRTAAALLCLIVAAVASAPANAAPAPRLANFLKTARLVVSGDVTAVTPYDSDRVAVVEFAVEQTLKGQVANGPLIQVAIIEMHEGSNRPGLAVGARGVAFLRAAQRSSYLAKSVPEGSYYELLPGFGSFVSAASKADAERQTAIIARLAAAARGTGMDATAARKLTFDLLTCDNPDLVNDAIPGITDLKQPQLSADELSVLDAALLRASLPDRVRIPLINGVAAAGIRQAVPSLQRIQTPTAVAEAAWQALDTLGASAPEKDIETRLANTDPAVRAAAARELLRREGADAVSQVAPLAIQDSDPSVRKATVEALGALGKPEALPPLERVFANSPADLQQTAGRSILAVGGQPAVEAFGRLAFNGTEESQRYAVVLLMLLPDPGKQAVLDRIAKTHPNAEVRNLVEHGLPVHEH